MKPILLRGGPAVSAFRISPLVNSTGKALPALGISSIETRFVYLLHVEDVLPEDVLDKTYALLGSEGEFTLSDGFLVTPRKGTISPWSSKATDIFHNCGLTNILRVERGIHYRVLDSAGCPVTLGDLDPVLNLLHDRMTEGIYTDVSDMFDHMQPAPYVVVDVMAGGMDALRKANVDMGLALSEEEMEYLYESYSSIKRNPTDVELVMFGQVNSEHCRHKIFNADWTIDGEPRDKSLFAMIRNTHEKHPDGTLVAYKDNSGVLDGVDDEWFEVRRDGSSTYSFTPTRVDMVMKVETHNHPTAISPFPGAATGVGGEIRDESATGTGSKSKAGLSGFMVSNLRVPGFLMPWEKDFAEFPSRLATPLEIMTEGPLGGASFGNEFGRPQLFGLFKTLEESYQNRYRGYHKPIMVAGGMGNIKRAHVHKKDIPAEAAIIQIGGPAMRIGLGGGAASSMATGSNAADLDFDSVQRGNAEVERRCQEVIDACIALGEDNPVLSIHDIGAGGLSNGCPELIADIGGAFQLRDVHNEDISMSPMEIWCCEAQERYVLAVMPSRLQQFIDMCERERCPVAVIGKATGDGHLSLHDSHFENMPIDIDLGVILGKPPRMHRDVARGNKPEALLNLSEATVEDAVERVLHLPAVSNKTFLITITDRSVTGMVARDQMVGPYQTPVSDVAVTATSFKARTGEAMAMGERTNVALISPPASGRLAIGEALTNIAAADVGAIGNVKLSANWMCACGEDGEDAGLYDTVQTVGMELCPQLGISIPVGKDSLSMRTLWETSEGQQEKMVAPLSLVVSSFSPVRDVRNTVTPDLKNKKSALLLLDLGLGRNRLGGSALAQVYNQVGDDCPDVDNPDDLAGFFSAIQELISSGALLAYHDRSDGGVMITLAEMAFGGRMGLSVDLPGDGTDPLPALFSEELGAVIQVEESRIKEVETVLEKHGVGELTRCIGAPSDDGVISISVDGRQVLSKQVSELNRTWSELTYRMQALRDNPACAEEEFAGIQDENDPGMSVHCTYDPSEVTLATSERPKMAILREQGINGQVEMAAAFHLAGFESIDVHMTDLISGRRDLDGFAGLVACGGFSYGDVLGAGSGWAKSILFNDRVREMFRRFFARPETFSLGVCNGCQMMSQLKSIIPGTEHWPEFVRNKSEQFEARYVSVEIMPSPSILLKGMEGSRIPIPVAHGEGRADFSRTGSMQDIDSQALLAVRYVDNLGNPSEKYPANPNGSEGGMTGFTTVDGRATIMMPHPERGFRSIQMSYRPEGTFECEEGPWMKMFRNARAFVG